jgi:type I restriction enzyme M protein
MTKNNNSAATIGFENELWRAADALRSNMDAAEYKHIVLSPIFLGLHHRSTSWNRIT